MAACMMLNGTITAHTHIQEGLPFGLEAVGVDGGVDAIYRDRILS